MYHQRSELLKWVIIFVLVGAAGWYYLQNQSQEEGILMEFVGEEVIEEKITTGTENIKIGVHAAGAVKRPGVYFLSNDARVVDLLQAAGGVKGTADLNQINLAAPLVDGQKITVPEQVISGTGNPVSNNLQRYHSENGKISINTGTREDLLNLPGIGPSKAAAIIFYREENGPFRKLEDILKVQGIGEKTFEKLKSQITL